MSIFDKNNQLRRLWLCFSDMLIFLTLAVSCTSGPAQETNNQCSNEFAFIGSDGNVMLYDVCNKSQRVLTTDAVQSDPYYFFDRLGAWSSNGLYLIVGNSQKTLVLDLASGKSIPLKPSEGAAWSPSGNSIALSGNEQVSVVDIDSEKIVAELEGHAPGWAGREGLVYLATTRHEDHLLTQQLYHWDQDSGVTDQYAIFVISPYPINESILSSDGIFAKFYSQNVEYAPNTLTVNIQKSGQFELDESVVNARAFRWSPIRSVLVECKGREIGAKLIVSDYLSQTALSKDLGPCWVGTRISWTSSGNVFAYMASVTDINLVNSNTLSAIYINFEPENFGGGIVDGPFISPDGEYVSIVFNDVIYLTSTARGLDPNFQAVIDASAMAWRP